ncbi:hypothetical protein MHM93_14295 [Pseudoalteromonas sp. MM17-2]|uniref:hypothetical protein n=1 Tax=Pseudoalteromonas sp. MM17-2 TaxID=2917753 RepID=UPI001EF578F3|nr:hypothetical protein [Pseudoalteromonas sp. MM17-2]MCG7545347.1 hypothetical protein [Pseudoalteromonas sp. MM17-2]
MSGQSENKERLHRQLVRLGDMMGDGLHHEPDGKWIAKEYRRVAKALGYPVEPQRKSNVEGINKMMANYLNGKSCTECNGQLKQTRSGAKRMVCLSCGAKFQVKTKS